MTLDEIFQQATARPWASDQVAGGFNIGTTDFSASPAKWNRLARVGGELAGDDSEARWQANARLMTIAVNHLEELVEQVERLAAAEGGQLGEDESEALLRTIKAEAEGDSHA